MKRGSAIFLKIVISLTAIAALAAGILGLPEVVANEAAKTPETAYLLYLFLVYAYILSILFFFGLFQVFSLLKFVDMNNTFSESTAGALRRLKFSATAIGTLMAAGIVTLMVISRGKGEDITGIVAPALLFTFASIVVAGVAAVLQKRVKKTLDDKIGNDLKLL